MKCVHCGIDTSNLVSHWADECREVDAKSKRLAQHDIEHAGAQLFELTPSAETPQGPVTPRAAATDAPRNPPKAKRRAVAKNKSARKKTARRSPSKQAKPKPSPSAASDDDPPF